MHKIKIRNSTGSFTAELPAVIFVIFIVLALPMANLATIGFRAAVVLCATRNAAHFAGRCRSFEKNLTSQFPSAKTTAKEQVRNTLAFLPAGINIQNNDIKVFNVAVPIDNGRSIVKDRPLKELNSQKFTYQLRVVVRAEVDPLVNLNPEFFGEVPGLTIPLVVTTRAQEYCEFPAGLLI